MENRHRDAKVSIAVALGAPFVENRHWPARFSKKCKGFQGRPAGPLAPSPQSIARCCSRFWTRGARPTLGAPTPNHRRRQSLVGDPPAAVGLPDQRRRPAPVVGKPLTEPAVEVMSAARTVAVRPVTVTRVTLACSRPGCQGGGRQVAADEVDDARAAVAVQGVGQLGPPGAGGQGAERAAVAVGQVGQRPLDGLLDLGGVVGAGSVLVPQAAAVRPRATAAARRARRAITAADHSGSRPNVTDRSPARAPRDAPRLCDHHRQPRRRRRKDRHAR